jgi:hypothetical protein
MATWNAKVQGGWGGGLEAAALDGRPYKGSTSFLGDGPSLRAKLKPAPKRAFVEASFFGIFRETGQAVEAAARIEGFWIGSFYQTTTNTRD